MKKYLVISFLVWGAGMLSAQNTGVILSNNEATWLYYALDPNTNFSRSASEKDADQYAAVDRFTFSALPPGGFLRHEGLAPGSHNIICFWASEQEVDYDVSTLRFYLAAGQIKKFTLKKTGIRTSLESKTHDFSSALPANRIAIDNDYGDWAGYPDIAFFPPSASPTQFTSQSPEGARNLSIRNSRYWGSHGTKLLTVKALFSPDALSLYFSSSASFTEGLSVFLYLFEDRNSPELNTYTIELPLETETNKGRVILWRRGVKEPLEIGAFMANNGSLEAAVELAKLPEDLRIKFFDKYSFDLKTSYYDRTRSFHEEFFLTSMDCRDIYVIK